MQQSKDTYLLTSDDNQEYGDGHNDVKEQARPTGGASVLDPESLKGVARIPHFDVEQDYPAAEYVFSFKEVPFAPMGGLTAVTGQTGHGKSTLLSLLIAAALKGQDGFGGLRWEGAAPPKIAYIDTEQEDNFVKDFHRKVADILGETLRNRDDFWTLPLANLRSVKDRWLQLRADVYDCSPNVIIIDGILDFVDDMNNCKAAVDCVEKMKGLAREVNAAVICVNHQNPSPHAEAGDKLAGHIGSVLMRKATYTFNVRKGGDKDGVGPNRFKVSNTKARGRAVDDLFFEYAFGGIPQLCGITASDGDIATEHTRNQARDWAMRLFKSAPLEKFTRKELTERAKSVFNETNGEAKSRIAIMIECGFIGKDVVATGGGNLYYWKGRDGGGLSLGDEWEATE